MHPTHRYKVFTELAHLKRGRCCGNGCRHCPFGHVGVADERRRTALITRPTLVSLAPPTAGEAADKETDVLFWSGVCCVLCLRGAFVGREMCPCARSFRENCSLLEGGMFWVCDALGRVPTSPRSCPCAHALMFAPCLCSQQGKDSYLALLALERLEKVGNVALLTTFQEGTKIVPHQEVSIDTCLQQARHLSRDIVAVPLPDPCRCRFFFK